MRLVHVQHAYFKNPSLLALTLLKSFIFFPPKKDNTKGFKIKGPSLSFPFPTFYSSSYFYSQNLKFKRTFKKGLEMALLSASEA